MFRKKKILIVGLNFQIRHVETAYVHPYFSPEQSSDIGLLKLDEPLEFNDYVKGKNPQSNRPLI